MSVIQRQEELIEKLQEIVSNYLNESQFEIAKSYSEILKLACEAYRDLKGDSKLQVQESPQRQLSKPFNNFEGDARYFSSRTPKISPEQSQVAYQQKMQAEYAYNQSQQPRTVISAYTYGDGADNPKIRASDSYGNWKHEEPNEVITPPQQVIPNKFQANKNSFEQSAQLRAYSDCVAIYEDAWAEDNNDMSFQDPRRNGFYQQ